MVQPKDRVKGKKFRRTPGARVSVHYAKKKNSKCKCSLCKKVMHGMPHSKTIAEVRKLPKSKRRPEVLFAGKLCNKCRTLVVEEAIKLKEGLKTREEIALNLLSLIDEINERIE